MKIQLSELNLTYVLGWYGTCDTNQEFDLNTISSSISSVLQIADDNHTWKSFEPGSYSSDFGRLVPGHIYYFTFNRGTNEVDIPDLVKTNYSDAPMSQQRITDQCGGNSSNGPDFGSGSETTPLPDYGDSGQTPFTETPVSIQNLCCGGKENHYVLASGQRFETPTGESLVSQHNGTLCFDNISADMNGNAVLYYVSISPTEDEVHLEVTVQTSNQINNIFSFNTEDGRCFAGTLDYMTPSINRFIQVDFPTPTPIDFGSGTTITPTPNPVDATFNPTLDDVDDVNFNPTDDSDDSHDDTGVDPVDANEEYNPPFGPVDGAEPSEDNIDPVDSTIASYNDQVHQMHKERISVLTNSRSYSFDFQWTGDVPLESLNNVTIRVENNLISDITSSGVSIDPTTTPREHYTMEMLFLYVENEMARNPNVANISYNEELGYISSFDLDMSTDQEFDKVGFQVSNFNAGDLNNSVDDLLPPLDFGDVDNSVDDLLPPLDLGDVDNIGDDWNEETDYYEEGEVPVFDDGNDTPITDSTDADPISEIPEDLASDSNSDYDSDFGLNDEFDYASDSDSDFGLNDEFDYAPTDTIPVPGGDGNFAICPEDVRQCRDGTYVSRNSNNNCEFDLCPDEIDMGIDGGSDDYTGGVSDSVDYTGGVSDSVDQVSGYALGDVATSIDEYLTPLPSNVDTFTDVGIGSDVLGDIDGYLNPPPNNVDTFTAPEENPWADLDTLE